MDEKDLIERKEEKLKEFKKEYPGLSENIQLLFDFISFHKIDSITSIRMMLSCILNASAKINIEIGQFDEMCDDLKEQYILFIKEHKTPRIYKVSDMGKVDIVSTVITLLNKTFETNRISEGDAMISMESLMLQIYADMRCPIQVIHERCERIKQEYPRFLKSVENEGNNG